MDNPLTQPRLLIVAGSHHHGHGHHYHPHGDHNGTVAPGGGGKGGGKGTVPFSFCGADSKVACVALTVAAALGLVIAAANVLLAVRRARLLKRAEVCLLEPLLLRSSSSQPSSPRASPRASNAMSMSMQTSSSTTTTSTSPTAGTLSALAAAALAVSHLLSSASSSSTTAAASFDEKLYHLCLAATWTTASVLCCVSASCGRAPRVRPVAWGVPVLYVVEAVVVSTSSGSSSPSSSSSSSSSTSLIYAALAFRAAVALCLAVAQARRGLTAADAEEDALATKALLAGPGLASAEATEEVGQRQRQRRRRDVENPLPPSSSSSSPSKGPSRGWISLLGVAVAFVWPEDPAHQARAAACVLLLVLSRVANLAVPASYAYLVNRLAAADASAHPSPGSGEPPHPVPLRSLLVPAVAVYLAALYLQGGSGGGSMGLLNNARQYAWIPISQAAARKINVDAFAHVLSMDLKYHLMRKTGELTRVLDRGSSAIQNLLSTVLFQVGPQLFDIAAAAVYVCAALQPWVAAIMFVTLASYIPLTIYLTEWRGKYRKDLNAADNARSARATDALLSYETVKYFCAEKREVTRLADAIDDYQFIEKKLLGSLNVLNVIQSTVIFAGTAAGLLVCSKHVADGSLRVGDAVLFLSLMAQLAIPLNWFGTFYRTIQQQMLDADGMFTLLAQMPTVVDAPDAVDLPPGGDGSIEFRNVTFSWEKVVGIAAARRAAAAASATNATAAVPRAMPPAAAAAAASSSASASSASSALDPSPLLNSSGPVLKDVSLRAPGGTSLAIVGPTGSGKSTLLRLAFRFVDPDSGSVLIEGHDAKTLKQASMRSIMSVTPQESVLFNDTIEYNLRYANPGATREEVENAARVAAIHDTILSFPHGYQTVVGERGLRLSGGEKQRVALARAVLRRAKIMLLDESTSALDALTEAAVQRALRNGVGSGGGGGGGGGGAGASSSSTTFDANDDNGTGATGAAAAAAAEKKAAPPSTAASAPPPTMLIVAHRLSTIMHCDSIAVMQEGRVVEVGTHAELVAKGSGGLYASMWARQSSSSSSSAALVEEEEEREEGEKEKKSATTTTTTTTTKGSSSKKDA